MLSYPTVLLCGKLCRELLYFILEHTELKLQRMTNGIISKYELADKKTLETSGSWLTVEQKKGNKMALICTRDLAKFK